MSSRSLIFDVLVYSIHISSSSNLILKINSRPGDHWCIAGHLCSARCLCCTDFSFSQCIFRMHRTVPQVKQKGTCSMKSNCCLRSLGTTTTMIWTLVRMPFYKFIRNVLKLLFHNKKNNLKKHKDICLTLTKNAFNIATFKMSRNVKCILL